MENKLGLALSGGGFRASLFHIGILTSLAELDILKNIEVISCVSGGSIIGAYYYLHLKKLLELKQDSEIRKEDFIDIMREIQVDFLKGVQKNIRVRVFGNVWKTIKMTRADYSRSDRIAELYDQLFYNKFLPYFNKDPRKGRISLRELLIQPKGSEKPFDLRRNNENRTNKVPMLILNSTTLNTGRNWQFTAIDMGERDPDIDYSLFDKNSLLKAVEYYGQELKGEQYEKYRNIPLSIAVSASACVPALFAPLALTDLYPEVIPQLVDGGVYDNQGLSTIFYEKCTEVIISDAGGQVNFIRDPSTNFYNVLSRTNSVLMNQLRNEGLESAVMRKKTKMLDKKIILHLKKDLDIDSIYPGQREPMADKAKKQNTTYGINKYVQYLMSNIRTDLDSFTDVEAHSLMYDGYAMAKQDLESQVSNQVYQDKLWDFLQIKEYCEGKKNCSDYRKQLKFSSKKVLKAYRLMPYLNPLGIIIVLLSLIPIAVLVYGYIQIPERILQINKICFVVAVIVLSIITGIPRLISVRETLIFKIPMNILFVMFSLSAFILSWLHLKIIDPFFIKRGMVRNLK